MDNKSRTKQTIKKVVLVAPPMQIEKIWGKMQDFAEVSPPLALCSIAGFLRDKQYDVSIVDGEVHQLSVDETVEKIIEEEPDIIGITCKTLWMNCASALTKDLKKQLPRVPVVAGGHHPTSDPERTLRQFPEFDFLVLGEGELTFLELIRALNDGHDLSSVNGIAYKTGAEVNITNGRERMKDLDALPLPALDLIPNLEKFYPSSPFYGIKGASFPLMTSRGCPYNCTFCDKSVYKTKITYHSPEYVIEMIKHLYHEHDIHYHVISDDNFLLNPKRLNKILDLLEQSGLKIGFSCQSRVDTINPELLKRLKKAGCKQIMFGIESGSQKILDRMDKRIKISDVYKAIKMTKEAKIVAIGYFIIGFPGETKETMEETLKLIKDLPFDDIMCSYYTPFPGAPVYNNINTHGKFIENYENTNSMELSFIPNDTTEKMLREYYTKYYNACYGKGFQMFSIPRRIPTFKHFKVFLKLLFAKY